MAPVCYHFVSFLPARDIAAPRMVAAFAVFWDGQVGAFAEEGGIGAILSGALLLVALSFPALFR